MLDSVEGADTLGPLTLEYKIVDDAPICLDVYFPPLCQDSDVGGSTHDICISSVVYFHGGGLTVGDRKSWFPHWLQKRLNAAGCAFISADYRLLPPSTGHDVLADIKDLFEFLSRQANPLIRQSLPGSRFQLDPNSIAVSGTSAGGLCAYLAAIHASPKPVAILSMYGVGGDLLTPHYLTPKTVPFFRGRELLEPTSFAEYLYPYARVATSSELSSAGQTGLASISGSPLSYHPASSPTPGYPSNPRMLLTRLYLQLAIFLDFYTGRHEPSLSSRLRESIDELPEGVWESHDSADRSSAESSMRALITDADLPLFPQFNVSKDWPPTLLVHGSSDTAVKLEESSHLHNLLQRAGVDASIKIIDGQEHSFDYQPKAEATYGDGLFDEISGFLLRRLKVMS